MFLANFPSHSVAYLFAKHSTTNLSANTIELNNEGRWIFSAGHHTT